MQVLQNVASTQHPSIAPKSPFPPSPNLMEPYSRIAGSYYDAPLIAAPPPRAADPVLHTAASLRHRAWAARIGNCEEGTVLVEPRDSDHLLAARPGEDGDAEGVFGLCEAKCGGNFAAGLAPDEACDLCSAVDGGDAGAGHGVVEVDAAIVGAAADGQETPLPGTKGDGLYGGVELPTVLCVRSRNLEDGTAARRDGVDALAVGAAADINVCGGVVAIILILERLLRFEQGTGVVIATTGEELAVDGPRETADLLRMDRHAGKQRHGAVPAEDGALR